MALRIQCYARMPPPATGTLPGTIISPLAELAETTHIARNLTRQTKRLPPGRFLQFKVIATDGIIVIRIAGILAVTHAEPCAVTVLMAAIRNRSHTALHPLQRIAENIHYRMVRWR